MIKNKENEELLKDRIFSCFSASLREPNRQQVYIGQLSGLIYEWCRDYLSFDINSMGVEIVDITISLLKKEDKSGLQDKVSLIKYLLFLLKNKKIEYIRNNYEVKLKKNSEFTQSNFEMKIIKDIIHLKNSFIGRKLNEDERQSFINIWYDSKNSAQINDFTFSNSSNDENPLTAYINSENSVIIRKAIKTVLDKKQDRSRDCLRALLTLKLIDNVDLYPVLDKKIIERCRQDTEIPNQYKIYQEYHPEVSKGGAEAQASKNLKDLLSAIAAYLKENNPEISP